ncbi:MAG: SH3 domain-containing protein [Thermodesulfobacteriota bacterium]|nr:SH3 domain-containing protein [Thermodesulfobacteriota bacterium]
MQRGADHLKGHLLFHLLFLVIFWTEPGLAFEPWKGEIGTNVNLRKSPGLDGEVITGLRKGDRVVIRDERGDWYKIAVERETYGYKGWVYAVYVKAVHTDEARTSHPLDKPNQAPPLEETPSKDALAPLQQTHYSAKEVAESEPQGTGTQETPPPKGMPPKSTSMPIRKTFQEVVRVETNKRPPSVTDTDDLMDLQGPGVFVRLLLRLSSVILSCLALLFSYRALRLAKVSRDVALRLQHNPQNPR